MSNVATSAAQSEAEIDRIVAEFGDLPTLAPVAFEVVRIADDENASMGDISAAISRDPGLATRMLRLANSAMYAPSREVTSIDRAAVVLGLRTVKLVSLGFSVVAGLDDAGPIDETLLWQRSLVASVLGRNLATVCGSALGDEAFIAGLLGHIGKVALADDPLFQVIVANGGGWPDADAEEQELGFTSDDVTARVLSGWGLPAVFAEAIAARRDPIGVEGPAGELAPLLSVADEAAGFMVATDDDQRADAYDRLSHSAAAHLGLTLQQVEELVTEATPELDEISAMFEIESVTSNSMSDLVFSAQARLARLSLDMATALTEEQRRAEQLESDNERLAEQASTDALTGLPNRRTFDAFLANQIAGRSRRPRETSLGMLIMDLDHFKSVNDDFGHAVGDDVLRTVGQRLLRATRTGELSARIGGEEFAVVLPDTDTSGLREAANRFRKLIGDEPMETSIGPLNVTVSVGASCTRRCGNETAAAIHESSDTALYAAKRNGRDRVEVQPMD